MARPVTVDPNPPAPAPGAVGGGRRAERSVGFRVGVVVAVALVVVTAAAAVGAARRFDRTTITSVSMAPTISAGASIWVDIAARGGRGIDRDDIVVFAPPEAWRSAARTRSDEGVVGDRVAKRVIAVGGDTVVCCDARGRLVVDGEPLEEPYLAEGTLPSTLAFSVTVPPGHLWLMGDNRRASTDSRHLRAVPGAAFVPRSAVLGRLVRWP